MHAHHRIRPARASARLARFAAMPPKDDPFPELPKSLVRKVERAFAHLPQVAIHETNGTWLDVKVRKRSMAVLLAARNPAGVVDHLLIVRADPEERRALLAIGHPYFATRSGHDRVGIVLGPATDWTEIRELLTEAFLIRAPKTLAATISVPETG